jgi:hypothetical protein
MFFRAKAQLKIFLINPGFKSRGYKVPGVINQPQALP